MNRAKYAALFLSLLCAAWGCAGASEGEASGSPFRFADGLIWVKVTVAGAPLNFVVDSGAGASVLSLKAARILGLPLGTPVPVRTVDGSATGYRLRNFSATFGGAPLPREILVLDLDAACGACCLPIDGLIGQDFLRGRVVQIDFKARRVALLDHPADAQDATVLPMRRINDALCVPVGVNGQRPEWTRLDTGCHSALEWAAKVGPRERKGAPSIALAESSTASILADVRLGQENIPSVPTGLHARALFPGEAGLLGNGLLSKYCVTIDTRRMLLSLQSR